MLGYNTAYIYFVVDSGRGDGGGGTLLSVVLSIPIYNRTTAVL